MEGQIPDSLTDKETKSALGKPGADFLFAAGVLGDLFPRNNLSF